MAKKAAKRAKAAQRLRQRLSKALSIEMMLASYAALMAHINERELESIVDRIKANWRATHSDPASISSPVTSDAASQVGGTLHTVWAGLHTIDLGLEQPEAKDQLADLKSTVMSAVNQIAFTSSSAVGDTRFILVRSSKVSDGRVLNAFAWNLSEDVLRKTPTWSSDTSPFPGSNYEGPIPPAMKLPPKFPDPDDDECEQCDVYRRRA